MGEYYEVEPKKFAEVVKRHDWDEGMEGELNPSEIEKVKIHNLAHGNEVKLIMVDKGKEKLFWEDPTGPFSASELEEMDAEKLDRRC